MGPVRSEGSELRDRWTGPGLQGASCPHELANSPLSLSLTQGTGIHKDAEQIREHLNPQRSEYNLVDENAHDDKVMIILLTEAERRKMKIFVF